MPFWISEQLPFDRYAVDVGDGLRMHVMEQGEGTPVLSIHGNPTWAYLSRKIAAELEGEPIRLILPDLIGLGFSDAPPDRRAHTLRNHSDWVVSLLRQLDLTSVVAVVQDWGGPIGMHALSRLPGLMGGLVVLNTSIGAPKPGFKPTAFHRFFSTRMGAASVELIRPHHWLRFAAADSSAISPLAKRSYGYPLRCKTAREAAVGLVRMVPNDIDHPSVPLLRESGGYLSSFDGPAAIVWGENDPILGRLRARHERTLPKAEVTVTPAGHFVQEEAPQEIATAILSVVSRS